MTDGVGMYISAAASSGSYAVLAFSKPIDVTKYKTLTFVFKQTRGGSDAGTTTVGLSSNTTSASIDAYITQTTFDDTSRIYTIDISEMTGNKFFKVIIERSGNFTYATFTDIRFSQ